MTRRQALRKLIKMFPKVYVCTKIENESMRHPNSPAEHECTYSIYIAGIGYKYGGSFEECFDQL